MLPMPALRFGGLPQLTRQDVMTDSTVVATPTTGFWKRTWRLVWPYFSSNEWKSAWTLLIVVIALSLASVYISVQFNMWRREFYNMLNQKDLHDVPVVIGSMTLFTTNYFLYLMGKFLFLALGYIVIVVYALYLRQILQLRWRKWITKQLIDRWLGNRAYYRMQLQNYGSENPEQRIESDVEAFTRQSLVLSIDLITTIVNLASFSVILWGISGVITFSLGSSTFTVSGYMFWIAVAYALVGSGLAYWGARQLVPVNFDRERLNADFRFRMMRVRENAESIALYGGESREGDGLDVSFQRVWNNWWRYMILIKRLNWFQSFYGQLALVFPYL